MGSIAGVNIPWEVNVSGWLSNSWVWILIVCFIGFILICIVAICVFFLTYKRKVVIWEEKLGFLQPVLSTRARIIKLRAGGEEVMKTLFGGYYVSAYGQRIGRNSYYYLKGTDGYLYNFVLDKYATPVFVSGDMRMFNIAIDRMSQQTYGKVSWLEKHAVHILLFVFLIVLIIGLWLIVGRIGTVTQPLGTHIKAATDLMESNNEILVRLDSILRRMGALPAEALNDSGLVPAG